MAAQAERWNHNLHYHRVVLDTVPDRCRRALDVGCGEGSLARDLRRAVPHVVAVDLHEPSIRLARRQDAAGIDFLVGDFLSDLFEPASFDLVASVAALHHMDARLALRRMRDLLRPGGRLAVVGLARASYPPRPAARRRGRGGAPPAQGDQGLVGDLLPNRLAAAGDLRRHAEPGRRAASRSPLPATSALAVLPRLEQAGGLRSQALSGLACRAGGRPRRAGGRSRRRSPRSRCGRGGRGRRGRRSGWRGSAARRAWRRWWR